MQGHCQRCCSRIHQRRRRARIACAEHQLLRQRASAQIATEVAQTTPDHIRAHAHERQQHFSRNNSWQQPAQHVFFPHLSMFQGKEDTTIPTALPVLAGYRAAQGRRAVAVGGRAQHRPAAQARRIQGPGAAAAAARPHPPRLDAPLPCRLHQALCKPNHRRGVSLTCRAVSMHAGHALYDAARDGHGGSATGGRHGGCVRKTKGGQNRYLFFGGWLELGLRLLCRHRRHGAVPA